MSGFSTFRNSGEARVRSAVTCLLSCLLGAALGCGSAGMSSNSARTATPSNVSVTLQPVQPASPVQVVASATSPYPIKQWQLAVDSTPVWQQASSQPQIVQSIPLAAGQHQITVTATNSAGSAGSSSVAVTIPASGAAGAATTLSVALRPLGSSSPATVSAVAQGPNPLTGWALYLDGNLVDKLNTSSGTLTDTVQMTTGKHQIIARVWDNSGAYASATATADITASAATATTGSLMPTPPSSAKTWNGVEEKHGWSDCGACAGNPGGTGPTGDYWFKQGVSSPSLDGNSMETYIGGWVPWADNVFAYHFGPQNWANHILYTVHFFWNASKTRSGDGAYVVQAAEFDSYFFSNGFKYMFGTQCDYAGGYWGVWNGPDNKWQNTSLKCNNFPPNQWHTITWYLERDQNQKKLHFVAISVDGHQSKIDVWMPAVGSGTTDDSGIQFQQDSDQYGSPWNAWIDQVSFTIW